MNDEDGTSASDDEQDAPSEEAQVTRPRPACPSCGSVHTQPFPHAGPAARVNMRCNDCGHLFKDRNLRR